MKRLVVGFNSYKFGHRAIVRDGTSQPAGVGIFAAVAPTDPYTAKAIGPIYGVSIGPESEVRGVDVLPPNGGRLPVWEGAAARVRKRIDQCGSLIIDALDPHDGTLVLYCAESPEECDALPVAEVATHRSLWMQYNSATATQRAMAYPRGQTQGQWGTTTPSTAESRMNNVGVTGAYTDDGTTTDGDHTIEFTIVGLARHPEHVGGGAVSAGLVPTWQKDTPGGGASAGAVTVSGNTDNAWYARLIGPTPGIRGVVVAVTTASSEGNTAARTLHQIQVSRGV